MYFVGQVRVVQGEIPVTRWADQMSRLLGALVKASWGSCQGFLECHECSLSWRAARLGALQESEHS